jgi:tetratricopeptide (TPR) repeat protein
MIEEPKNRRTQGENSVLHSPLRCFVFATLVLVCGWAARAEDVVVVRSASDPAEFIKRTGEIFDYTGTELKLRTALGSDEKIPAARVVEIQTTWTAAHETGRKARMAGKPNEAIDAFQRAKQQERRAWAARQIRAELAGTFLEGGDIGQAGDEFLAIAATDPTTPHFDIIPIAWQVATLDAASEARAAAWLADDRAFPARLLGASWLLRSSRHSEAVEALHLLANSSDQRLAGLAKIQLWRSRLETAGTSDLDEWTRQLEAMPAEIQAAGWFVLGEAYAARDDATRAAIAYLKPAILFRKQRVLAADGLLAAAKQLEKLGQPQQAAGLYGEIVRDFAHLPAADEARNKLRRSQ